MQPTRCFFKAWPIGFIRRRLTTTEDQAFASYSLSPLRLLPFAFCLLPFALFLTSGVQAQSYHFKIYNSSTGLPGNALYHIYQDRKGYLWFCTGSGACCYDGVSYTTLGVQQGLADPSVRTIFEDHQGRFWLATQGGVSCWDGTHLTNYTTAEGLGGNEVYAGLCTRQGTIWFGTSAGISRFDGTRFISYGKDKLPPGRVWTLFEDQQGALWAGIRGGGLVKIESLRPDAGGAVTITAYGHQQGLPDEHVFGLAQDARGVLWVATSGGLCSFDGTSFHCYTVADGLSINMTAKVLVDRHQRVWCATFGGGLCRLENGRFTNFNRTNGLPNDYLTALMEDAEGNIWCGTWLNGLFRFSSELFASYPAASGLGEGTVTGIGETPDGKAWFSSMNNGLLSLDARGDIHRYTVKDGLPEESLWCLYVDSRGRVWTGGYLGVSYFDGRTFHHFTREQMGARDRITAIIEDRRGRLWFGSHTSTSNGVIMYDGQRFTGYSKEQGLVHNQVTSFMLDHTGDLWMCCEGGLSRFDGTRFVNYRTEDGLPNRRVRCMFEDAQGTFWVGTTDGLCRFDGKHFQVLGTKDGLPSNLIRTITWYDGALWVGTSHGVAVMNGSEIKAYTSKDGLCSDEIYTGACLKRRDGSLWFGTVDGVIRYKRVLEISRSLAPRLYVTGIRVTGAAAPNVTMGRDGDVSPVRLAYDQNGVTFEFLGLSFVDEASVQYSFKLDGFDRDWSPAGLERSARYTNLPPGHYQFLVKAASAGGVWSLPQSVGITIRPPFWQTWIFRYLGLVTICALAYAAFSRHIHKLQRRQARRLKQVQYLQEQRIAALRQLLESIRVINSKHDLTTVLQNIAEESAHLIDGEPGGIGLLEGDQVVFKRMWRKDHWEDSPLTFHVGDGVAGKVVKTAQPIIVNDPLSSPDIKFPELLEKYYVYGFMDVPILTRTGKVVGVLDVRHKKDRVSFTEEDCQLIEALANQAAVAIENAALYGELEEKNLMISESLIELERLYQQEQEVTRTLHDLNRMKTNFLIVTSHEMRTPLTVLKGYNEALLGEVFGPLSSSQHRSLQVSQRMVDRLVTSFNDILEMLKINEGRAQLKFTTVDLSAVIREILAELSPFVEQRKQRIFFHGPEELPLSADREKIQLVLVNLIQNAIKFTQDGGELCVTSTLEAETAQITITDTGIGIEPSEIERIFDTFYTSPDPSSHTSGRFEFSARGTGLGLAIAKSYVEAHHGRIWAESKGMGQGSCFHIVLPLMQGTHHDEAETKTHKTLV